jgi:glycosyltransferase involved in cell wall biosynthesis
MPVVNRASTVGDAVESIIAQTLEDWELIVVDDGSTDGTADVVESFDDPRIRLRRLPENVGRGAARNESIRLARGELVAVCDSDDVSVPHRFQTQVDFLREHPEVGVVASQVLYLGATRASTGFRLPTTSDEIKRRMLRGRSAIPNQAAMIRRDLFEKVGWYEPEFRRAQDYEFFLRAMAVTEFHTLDKPLVLYRQSPATLDFSYWRRSTLYERLAVRWHRDRATGQDPPDFDSFSRRPDTRLRFWTYDLLRYVWFRARGAVHSLRDRAS